MTTTGSRIAIIGAGSIGAAIARGIVEARVVPASAVTLTRRNLDHLASFREAGYRVTDDNRAAAQGADVLVLAVTPQHLNDLLDELRGAIEPARHTVVSVVSGAAVADIRARLGVDVPIVRAMPNTAIALRQSMTCLATDAASHARLGLVKTLFDAVGQCVVITEDLMVPATALCACGIAFFLRAIRAASQGGIEIGFHAEDALLMAAQTARGAATLLVDGRTHPESEVDKVTTPQGCTISGLNQMEHNGFSSAMIRGITTAADKAAELYAPR
jgi:pyrroline-5-carboxylate reductase